MKVLLHRIVQSLLYPVLLVSPLSFAYAGNAETGTRGGLEWGFSVSNYRYEEPSVGMYTAGDKFSVSQTGTLSGNDNGYLREELRFVYGRVDYVGSGIQKGVPDWYIEARGLMGRDFQAGGAVFSPYVGIGYRFLFNDLRGYSNTGSVGYRRESNYLYIPMGLTHRFAMQDGDVLATTLEYDLFVQGQQVSKLSDTGLNWYTDVSNNQKSGFGLRGDVMYSLGDFEFGPFLIIWDIKDSEVVQGGLEPQNRTTEFGFRTNFRF